MPAVGPLRQILEFNATRIRQTSVERPAREFILWFTARSGSSHLAELLTSAQVGDVREWLNPAFMERQADFFGATTFGDYFQRIRSHCPKGTFGQKLTIAFYEAFAGEVRLEDHFDFAAPSILLYREDLVEQALSLSLANRRKVFHQTSESAQALPSAAYDPSDLMRCAEALHAEEQRLHSCVQRHRASPRYVSYEQFVAADPRRVVAAAAQLVGVAPELARMQSRHRKLDDPEHRAQLQRFVAEHPEFCDSLWNRRSRLLDAARASPLLAP